MLHSAFTPAEGAFTSRQAHGARRSIHETAWVWSARGPSGFATVSVALILIVWLASPLQAQTAEPSEPRNLTISVSEIGNGNR